MSESRLNWLGPILITLIVIIGYGIRPTRLPLISEETCRARHGIEMFESGDWLVATLQGVPILDRPPLQYWTFGIIHGWIHPLNPLTIRLTQVVITLVTALLVWWYARRFTSPTAATVAGIAYPTMGHVFDLGRRAETDALFTLLVAASLLVWHAAYSRHRSPVAAWTGGCILAAMAALTKGTQAIVAFFGSVYLFLLIRRDWRSLRHGSHWIGLLLFVVLIALWQVPFWRVAGWQGTYGSWFDPGVGRLGINLADLALHLLSFPFEVLGATLPWSILLLGMLLPGFWRLNEKLRSSVLFLGISIITILVPVWINIGGKPRYTMPLEPLVAVLCGFVAYRCLAPDASRGLQRLWRGFFVTCSVLLAVGAVFVLAATIAADTTRSAWATELAQPWPLMMVLMLGSMAVLAAAFLPRSVDQTTSAVVRTVTLAAMVAVIFNGPVLNGQAAKRTYVGPEINALRKSLPPGARLISFGTLHQHFVYWYAEPIPVFPVPKRAENVPEEVVYFAVNPAMVTVNDLPFAWEEVARLNMDINKHPPPIIIVGRRVFD